MTDEQLTRTLDTFSSRITDEMRDGFREVREKLGDHGETLAAVREKVQGHEHRIVKVESRSMVPKDHSGDGLTTKQLIALISGVIALVCGGGGFAVTQQVSAATDEAAEKAAAAERAQREALALLARAVSESSRAQVKVGEAAATLDPEAAEAAAKAARDAVAEALRAERAIRVAATPPPPGPEQ